ncbi:MAG: adenylyltransferase/cytidyltransferase family protein [Propionibacteriaceae bacterium]|nr:adenylyltransferase/cytidyltransferase family protein [Propionibacteriaceae bacterium]
MDSDRARKGVVGYVPGAWDMFHIGHLNLLNRARENCDWLVAGVVTDETLFAMKGKYPIVSLDERLAIVAAIGIVDEAVVDQSANKLAAWEQVHFDVLFKGDDWRGTAKGLKLEQAMATVGARVHYFPYTLNTSSTELRRALGEY